MHAGVAGVLLYICMLAQLGVASGISLPATDANRGVQGKAGSFSLTSSLLAAKVRASNHAHTGPFVVQGHGPHPSLPVL